MEAAWQFIRDNQTLAGVLVAIVVATISGLFALIKLLARHEVPTTTSVNYGIQAGGDIRARTITITTGAKADHRSALKRHGRA